MESLDIVPIQFTDISPRYQQIAEYYEDLLVSGTIAPGEKLPAIRRLAAVLQVNSVTVVKAYDLLAHKQLVIKTRGSGVFAAGRKDADFDRSHFNSDELFRDDEIQLIHGTEIDIPAEAINLATATPSSDLFPVSHFRKALNEVLDRDGAEALGYDESSGYYPLRETVCTLLADSYGIAASAEHLQIISGAQQGIDIAAKALLSPKDWAVLEDPTYPGAAAVFASRGAGTLSVFLNREGIDLVQLEAAVKRHRPKLMYCMSDFQNPTAGSCSASCRTGLLDIARTYGMYIIEDDYVSDLRFSQSRTVPLLKALDRPEDPRVIYIKSFSKLIMPGLRIGFLLSPAPILRKMLQAKHMTDISSSGLLQRAFELYLRSGAWEEHLAYRRKLYESRFRVCLDALSSLESLGFRFTPPEGGVHFWLTLPEGLSARALFRKAAAGGVLCTPGNVFRTGNRDYDDHIRISTAAAGEEDIRRGIHLLAETAASMMHPGSDIHHRSPIL